MASSGRFRKIGKGALLLAAAAVSVLLLLFVHCRCNEYGGHCVNQGEDERKFATFVCCLQRHMSWKSTREPHFVLFGRPDRTNLGIAWPPYLVFNSPAKQGRWHLFRIGFRYDRNWHGYIFPTLAFKSADRPLRY